MAYTGRLSRGLKWSILLSRIFHTDVIRSTSLAKLDSSRFVLSPSTTPFEYQIPNEADFRTVRRNRSNFLLPRQVY